MYMCHTIIYTCMQPVCRTRLKTFCNGVMCSNIITMRLSIISCSPETLDDWIQMEEKHCLNLTLLDGTLDPALETKCWEFLQVRINLLIKQYPAPTEKAVSLINFH